MIIDIPKNNKYSQVNDGEINGTLSSTFCCDFEKNRGQLSPATRVPLVSSESDVPTAFAGPYLASIGAITTDRYWATVDSGVRQSTGPFRAWSDDDESGKPADLSSANSDIILYNNRLYVSGSTAGNLYRRTSSSWTTIASATNGTDPNLMTIYGDKLYITSDGDKIHSMDDAEAVSTSGSYTFNLGNVVSKNHTISCIRAVSDGIWFGTVNDASGRALVYKWDGVTANVADNVYQVDAKGVMSIVIQNDRPYIVDSKGALSTFNGSYFQEIARLPMEDERLEGFDRGDNARFIHPNGMAVIDEQIHILVNNTPTDSNSKVSDRTHSGVWVFDEGIGLIHKHAICQTEADDLKDMGVLELSEVGAIYPAIQGIRDDYDEYTKFLAGATVYTDATTEQSGVFCHIEDDNNRDFTDIIKSAHFTTTKIQATQAQESWQNIIATYESMSNATDKIVVKYRNQNGDPTRATITWTSETTFDSTEDLSSVSVGDEITVVRGTGAGWLAHITAIAESGGTYTVTLDETITGATGTAVVKVQTWNKIADISDTVGDFSRHAIGAESTWIQFKVFLVGTGVSPLLNRIISVSDEKSTFK